MDADTVTAWVSLAFSEAMILAVFLKGRYFSSRYYAFLTVFCLISLGRFLAMIVALACLRDQSDRTVRLIFAANITSIVSADVILVWAPYSVEFRPAANTLQLWFICSLLRSLSFLSAWKRTGIPASLLFVQVFLIVGLSIYRAYRPAPFYYSVMAFPPAAAISGLSYCLSFRPTFEPLPPNCRRHGSVWFGVNFVSTLGIGLCGGLSPWFDVCQYTLPGFLTAITLFALSTLRWTRELVRDRESDLACQCVLSESSLLTSQPSSRTSSISFGNPTATIT